MYDILKFSWFSLIFCYPDPVDQNETDPNGSGSETLVKSISNLPSEYEECWRDHEGREVEECDEGE